MTPRFHGEVTVRQWGRFWVLMEPIRYEGSRSVTVPEGFTTDMASIPQVLWNLLAPTDPRISKPSIVHDRAYEQGILTQREADALLYEAMGATEPIASVVIRILVWVGVRLGGGTAYATAGLRAQERLRAYHHWLELHSKIEAPHEEG